MCRSERCRAARSGVTALPVPEVPLDDGSALLAAYRATLDQAGRLGLPEGAHVMYLAELLAAGKHTAAGAAALSKELRTAMERALQGAPQQPDELDELAARRAQKMTGA